VIEPSELDMAQLRHEMRTLYKNIGLTDSLQVIYEMLVGARVLSDIILEEGTKNEKAD
jgi:hypothetical protein